VITLETAGGGGYGDPANRSTQAMELDHLEGFCPLNKKTPEE
jgi:N-methylhydantoinase B/oxoprolinase/acetone carboxylase alpha subunit